MLRFYCTYMWWMKTNKHNHTRRYSSLNLIFWLNLNQLIGYVNQHIGEINILACIYWKQKLRRSTEAFLYECSCVCVCVCSNLHWHCWLQMLVWVMAASENTCQKLAFTKRFWLLRIAHTLALPACVAMACCVCCSLL